MYRIWRMKNDNKNDDLVQLLASFFIYLSLLFMEVSFSESLPTACKQQGGGKRDKEETKT